MKSMVNLDITVLQTKTAKELCKIIKKMVIIIDSKKRKSEAVKAVIHEANFALRMMEEAKGWRLYRYGKNSI